MGTRSYLNLLEAQKSIDVAKELIEKSSSDYQPTITILTPYKAQQELIKKSLIRDKLSDKINVYTIDSAQGKEWDAVILTLVRTGTKLGFIADSRRMNVALTRAKYVEII